MRKMLLAVTSAAALGGLAVTAANAMPAAPALPTASNVDQVRWVCDEWGRRWRSRDYDRPYRYYRDDDDDWRSRRGMGMAITTGHMIGVGMVAGIVVGTTTIDVPTSEYSQDSQILSLIPSTTVYPPFSMS